MPLVGRTRMVKMLYLFMEEVLDHFKRGTDINEDEFYHFFPWNFGPFSLEVFDDLKFFELRGFIETNLTKDETMPESAEEWSLWLTSSSPDYEQEQFSEYQEEEFNLTTKGCNFVKGNLLPELSGNQIKLLANFRSRLETVPLRALLKYVYENYPDQTVNSKIYEEVIGKRNY